MYVCYCACVCVLVGPSHDECNLTAIVWYAYMAASICCIVCTVCVCVFDVVDRYVCVCVPVLSVPMDIISLIALLFVRRGNSSELLGVVATCWLLCMCVCACVFDFPLSFFFACLVPRLCFILISNKNVSARVVPYPGVGVSG